MLKIKEVELFGRFEGQFDGITTRLHLKYDEQLLTGLAAIGYDLKKLETEDFPNKNRKITVRQNF